MKKIIPLIMCAFMFSKCTEKPTDFGSIPINRFQVIGSHNSYKKAIDEELLMVIGEEEPRVAESLEYWHLSLEDQLDLGLRNLELDVFYDPEGGKYSDPLGNRVLLEMGIEPSPFDTEGKLEVPGLKLFHAQDIDFRSHHLLLKDALRVLKKWSEQNPDHFPVIVTFEFKDGIIGIPGSEKPIPFDSTNMYTADEEILEVLGKERLITPDFVRNGEVSLEYAILNDGWPELNKVRGKFLFVADAGEVKRTNYLKSHKGKTERIMFVTAPEGDPEAAFMIINDPVRNNERIRELVKKGYMIRTRADSGTRQSRDNDYSRFEAAKESGAQVISTDYYVPNPDFSTYKVSFNEESYKRLNPLFFDKD